MFGFELNPLQIWLGLPCLVIVAAMLIWIVVGEAIDCVRDTRDRLAEEDEKRHGFEVQLIARPSPLVRRRLGGTDQDEDLM